MSNIQSSREHIIQSRISVPTDGYIGNLRDLLAFYDQNGPVGRDYDDSARLENDGETVSLVWEVKREPLPEFSELDNFLRFVNEAQSGGYTAHDHVDEAVAHGGVLTASLALYINSYQRLVADGVIKPL